VTKMKKIVVVLVCLLLIGAVFGVSYSALAKKPGGGGGKPPEEPSADPAIAYTREAKKGIYLSVMNEDGSNQVDIHTLVRNPTYIHPTWSPDGNSIAFWDDRELWRIDVEVVNGVPQGTNLQKLVTGGGCFMPAWSPSGDEILVRTAESTSFGLVPATGGTKTIIYTAPEGYIVYWGAWSPDASQIAFVEGDDSGPGKYNSIKILDLETNGITVVVSWDNWEFPRWLDWARTKDMLVFSLYGADRFESIYTLDLSDQSPTPEKIVKGIAPSWSPDDTKIVFEGKGISTYEFATDTTETIGGGVIPDWSRA
jgi:Tol biopolymer transport system component